MRFVGDLGVELRIACQDEILEFLLAAFLFGQVAVLALAAEEEGALQQSCSVLPSERVRCVGLVAIGRGLVPGGVARRIGAGGVIEVERGVRVVPSSTQL